MRVAVVILNWNGKSFLEKFLPSLFNSLQFKQGPSENINPFTADLFIADNSSSDGSKETFDKLKEVLLSGDSEQKGNQENTTKAHPVLEWIQLDRNYGFTGGYNRAFDIIRNAESGSTETDNGSYEYYVLINSDILVGDGWLAPLIEFMENRNEVSACQPKILSYARHSAGLSEQFEYAGAAGGFIDKWGFPLCRGRILSCIEEDRGQYDTPARCFWASGACMVVRSSVWHQLGGLDESFFAHMEEIDFCWRASLAGGEIWCLPQSRVYHVGGGTLPNNSPRKLYLNYRNNLLMLYKNLPGKGKATKIFLRKCIDGLSAVCYIFQGKFSYFKSVLKAHRDYRKLKRQYSANQSVPKENLSPSDSLKKSKKEALPYGMLPYSIILKFFTGTKNFSQL